MTSATAFAQSAPSHISIDTSIPGLAPATSISGLIQNFYSFALVIAGVLAFGAIVYGGIKYAVGHGNPSSESEGKSWIVGALLGLLLLASAYIILTTINPEITKLSIPQLPSLDAARTGEGLGGGASVASSTGGASSTTPSGPGARCQAPASGGCSVANLMANGGSCFGNNITLAAGVCNVESANGSLLQSGVDKCDDGSPVSFGGFQVNITANSVAGLDCRSAFSNQYTGSNRHCTITNRSLYNQCAQAAQNWANNIAAACRISNGGTNFRLWGPQTRQLCGI